MAVFLDSMVDHGTRIGRAGPRWCHMIADSLDELHAAAARIGLRRSWFQTDGSTPHYDIGSARIRELALIHGAVALDRRAFVEAMRVIRARAAFSRFREDGWPLCPGCGEDELYALANWPGEERPQLAWFLVRIDGCYRCNWAPATRAAG